MLKIGDKVKITPTGYDLLEKYHDSMAKTSRDSVYKIEEIDYAYVVLCAILNHGKGSDGMTIDTCGRHLFRDYYWKDGNLDTILMPVDGATPTAVTNGKQRCPLCGSFGNALAFTFCCPKEDCRNFRR